MKNKTCGVCRFFESKEFICCHSGDDVAAHFVACYDFKPMMEQKPTNGDKIRQLSDEELAEIFVCKMNSGVFYSHFTGGFYISEAEAIAATVAELKKEYKKQSK